MINWEKEKDMIETREKITKRIKEIIVESLELDISPEIIQNDQPLFGRGLELDSIDALELSLNVSVEFEVEINDDDIETWSSVNKLTDFILQEKANEN
ncbi:phosphopantetheine-binding protein [Staphylococcus pasteuri]|uniref:phosphopantetheine-binding protein n=1 Tax=Staphylococcus pasteuri TaxID=45972 RepID=UPI003D064C07